METQSNYEEYLIQKPQLNAPVKRTLEIKAVVIRKIDY